MLRVIFFGTPTFAVPTLDALLASRHEVVAVVTQPDRPSGRGQHMTAPPVKVRAIAAGLPCWQPDRLKAPEFLEQVSALAPDVGVVAAYGRILPQSLIDIPRFGLLNVHASLLPKYRGASPIQRAVMNGDAVTGVTIMRIVLALDAGGMFARAERAIGPDETSEDVERDLSQMGASLMTNTLDALEEGRATETPQNEAEVTLAPRLLKEDGLVDWSWPAATVHNRIRGLKPWPHAFTHVNGRRLVLLRGRTSEGAVPAGTRPGTVLVADGHTFAVATGLGVYELLEVQPDGRRAMSARDFLAGHPVEPGTLLGASAT